MMSNKNRLARLFSYDLRSYSFFEKRFKFGYKFMQMSNSGDDKVYDIYWRDPLPSGSSVCYPVNGRTRCFSEVIR